MVEQRPDLDTRIEELLKEFGNEKEEKEEDVNTKLKEVLEKNKKISKLLTDVTSERDSINDEL